MLFADAYIPTPTYTPELVNSWFFSGVTGGESQLNSVMSMNILWNSGSWEAYCAYAKKKKDDVHSHLNFASAI